MLSVIRRGSGFKYSRFCDFMSLTCGEGRVLRFLLLTWSETRSQCVYAPAIKRTATFIPDKYIS